MTEGYVSEVSMLLTCSFLLFFIYEQNHHTALHLWRYIRKVLYDKFRSALNLCFMMTLSFSAMSPSFAPPHYTQQKPWIYRNPLGTEMTSFEVLLHGELLECGSTFWEVQRLGQPRAFSFHPFSIWLWIQLNIVKGLIAHHFVPSIRSHCGKNQA